MTRFWMKLTTWDYIGQYVNTFKRREHEIYNKVRTQKLKKEKKRKKKVGVINPTVGV